MQHPDQKYINALVVNDKELVKEIYHKFSAKIKWLILQNNGSGTEAADIFQEVLLSVYKKAKTGDFILKCPLEAFLYVSCKNRWMSEFNKRKSEKVTINHYVGHNTDTDAFKLAEEFTVQKERRDLLNQKLEEMGEHCRKFLQLSWSGISIMEVAQILNITYG